jgi:hypothetical protein
MYLNNMKNSNDVDKSFCAVFTGIITYTMYIKLQNTFITGVRILQTPQIS